MFVSFVESARFSFESAQGYVFMDPIIDVGQFCHEQKLKPSACTPLFLAAFDKGAGCCIHTHSQWAVLVTLLVERDFGPNACFEIELLEQIKGVGNGKAGNLGYYDTLRIPILENTAQ